VPCLAPYARVLDPDPLFTGRSGREAAPFRVPVGRRVALLLACFAANGAYLHSTCINNVTVLAQRYGPSRWFVGDVFRP
jgi:hypothetical protein